MSGSIARRDEIIDGVTNKIIPLLENPQQVNIYIKALELCFKDTPKLFQCSVESIQACMLKTVITGLIPGKVTGEAWLIPFAGKATFIPGIRGLEKLVYESDRYALIVTQVVHENDKFQLPHMTDKGLQVDFQQGETRGEIIGAFSQVWTREGFTSAEYMNLDELYQSIKKGSAVGAKVPLVRGITMDRVRSLGKAYIDYAGEMFRGRVFARHAKRLQKSDRLAKAIQFFYEAPLSPKKPEPQKKTLSEVLG